MTDEEKAEIAFCLKPTVSLQDFGVLSDLASQLKWAVRDFLETPKNKRGGKALRDLQETYDYFTERSLKLHKSVNGKLYRAGVQSLHKFKAEGDYQPSPGPRP